MANETVNISVADDDRTRFPEIVRSLREAGLDVTQELESLGVVSGEIDSAKVADLQQIEGVAAVERQRSFRLAPPDSPVQ
jgi:hypothetical protein